MKRDKLVLFLLLVLLPFFMAMGALQGQNPEKIPVPAKKYAATFIDQMDIITDCREISLNGETFMEGKRGNGTIAIPFENIMELSFLRGGDKLDVAVKLRDGNSIQLGMNGNQIAYGRTKYGTYQIKLYELKKMTISKLPSQ